MPDAPAGSPKRPVWVVPVVLVLAVAFLLTRPGRAVGGRFLSTLRIEQPQRVQASFAASGGANPGRRVEDLVGRMLSDAVEAPLDEADRGVSGFAEAASLVGFTPALPEARTDSATFAVTGARTLSMKVKRAQLRTILSEAGEPAGIPASVDGATLTVKTARGVRVQYGHCPAPRDTTLQGQLQGPPPTTPENHDCVVLTETPVSMAESPAGLDTDQLVRIALEVSGMSPDQVKQFNGAFDWKASLSLALPRFMRSAETVQVKGVPGLLMTAGWRRGPTYVLAWTTQGMVYTLSGYGSPADGVPLASSIG